MHSRDEHTSPSWSQLLHLRFSVECRVPYIFSQDVTTLMGPKCNDFFECGHVGTIDGQVLVSW
jgi:hypothetical protein